MSGFQLKPMHYEYYAMIFWISFKRFLLPGFFWHCSGRIKQRGEWGTTLLLPSVCRSQVPHFAFIGPQGSSPYLLLGGGGSPDLSCDLHWHCWRLEGHFLLQGWGVGGREWKFSLPTQPFSAPHQQKSWGASLQSGKGKPLSSHLTFAGIGKKVTIFSVVFG